MNKGMNSAQQFHDLIDLHSGSDADLEQDYRPSRTSRRNPLQAPPVRQPKNPLLMANLKPNEHQSSVGSLASSRTEDAGPSYTDRACTYRSPFVESSMDGHKVTRDGVHEAERTAAVHGKEKHENSRSFLDSYRSRTGRTCGKTKVEGNPSTIMKILANRSENIPGFVKENLIQMALLRAILKPEEEEFATELERLEHQANERIARYKATNLAFRRANTSLGNEEYHTQCEADKLKIAIDKRVSAIEMQITNSMNLADNNRSLRRDLGKMGGDITQNDFIPKDDGLIALEKFENMKKLEFSRTLRIAREEDKFVGETDEKIKKEIKKEEEKYEMWESSDEEFDFIEI